MPLRNEHWSICGPSKTNRVQVVCSHARKMQRGGSDTLTAATRPHTFNIFKCDLLGTSKPHSSSYYIICQFTRYLDFPDRKVH